MTAPASTLTIDLVARFPGIVTAETRPDFAGFIVAKDSLVEVAIAIAEAVDPRGCASARRQGSRRSRPP